MLIQASTSKAIALLTDRWSATAKARRLARKLNVPTDYANSFIWQKLNDRFASHCISLTELRQKVFGLAPYYFQRCHLQEEEKYTRDSQRFFDSSLDAANSKGRWNGIPIDVENACSGTVGSRFRRFSRDPVQALIQSESDLERAAMVSRAKHELSALPEDMRIAVEVKSHLHPAYRTFGELALDRGKSVRTWQRYAADGIAILSAKFGRQQLGDPQ